MPRGTLQQNQVTDTGGINKFITKKVQKHSNNVFFKQGEILALCPSVIDLS